MFFSKTVNSAYSRLLTLRNCQVLCLGYFTQKKDCESRFQEFFKRQFSVMASSEPDVSNHHDKGNGLLLYLDYYSFYAQKVLMALFEKKIPFDTKTVNIGSGDQYQSWFLEINPRGEVPVLKDGEIIVPDSARIIDYLDDNFSNGNARLIPTDQGTEIHQKVIHFRNLIDPIPANVVTIGSFLHPQFVGKTKMPFIGPVRKALAALEKKNAGNLRKLAEKYPNISSILLEKAELQEKNHQLVKEEADFKKLLDQVDTVLKEVEQELSSRSGDDDRWLCSDRFTVADISLTILLDRLYRLGLDTWFWTDGKKPGITRYYERIRQRDSYKQTVPSTETHIKTFISTQKTLVVTSACAMATAAWLYFKKE